ncbi:hypothetical protein A3Q56_00639 [Intoshia linei]|uniref:Uncharacterized protein n=1 Tax=Intoshia linei TaxID=1819745 RepID=A0A177BB82_9BILA|nr:hypothetical protein A3Q56_00639 [Intoshia linei]
MSVIRFAASYGVLQSVVEEPTHRSHISVMAEIVPNFESNSIIIIDYARCGGEKVISYKIASIWHETS